MTRLEKIEHEFNQRGIFDEIIQSGLGKAMAFCESGLLRTLLAHLC